MKKVLATFAALAISTAFAMPASAASTEKRADGVRNLDQTEVSDQGRQACNFAPRTCPARDSGCTEQPARRPELL